MNLLYNKKALVPGPVPQDPIPVPNIKGQLLLGLTIKSLHPTLIFKHEGVL